MGRPQSTADLGWQEEQVLRVDGPGKLRPPALHYPPAHRFTVSFQSHLAHLGPSLVSLRPQPETRVACDGLAFLGSLL